MFKTFKNTAVCVLLAAIMLTGCSYKTDANGNVETGDFNWYYQIRNTPLVYDKDTKIMYYREYRFGMCPYYNEHGQMCYYVDGQIIPIEEVLVDVD